MSILTADVDYEPDPFPGVLIFPEGSGPGTILRDNVTIVDDDIVEETEDFDLSASITNPSDPARFVDTRDMAVGLIMDDDSTFNILLYGRVSAMFGQVQKTSQIQEKTSIVSNTRWLPNK